MIEKNKILGMLQKLGFTDKEANVYFILLELNEAIPSVISRKAGLKRPTTYLILEHLEARGLLSHIKRNNILYFRASRPEVFLEKEKAHLENTKLTLESLTTALPELINLHNSYVTPQMSVYHGKEGLIQIMEDTLTTKTELLCWSNPELAFNSLKEYYPTYIAKKVKNGIWLKGIFCDDKIGIMFKNKSKKELREVYLIPKEEFLFKNEINIYDDKVAIISHTDSVGVIIQNKDIADTQRAIFHFAFKYAKTYDRTK